ncbi:NAD(P)H-quinone oxidoreductase [Idiomarina aminovorans]|uniref:NAD(P)H-quinone oxidoreductase n=1 Tax=Idiomarina aminovorans TaxID=2914829 RepID=UPI0020046736|nr:NAD(P)H-quinone oxidoreductase [Idiomarina sp. ATCH4]MCK7460119.1 NAD(P)H-quinone oxidoreductase [Idiomarina sp. ATCH4]
MKAIQIIEHDSGQKVRWRSHSALDEPQCKEVQLRVLSAGINRADLMQIAGKYPPPKGASEIPGLEVCGVIERVGAEVADWEPGQRVSALLAGGGFAEKVNVSASQLLPVPENWSNETAAGWLETFATAYLNVFQLANLQPGERVLAHAGASGVGSSLIQLCRESGNELVAIVGSEEKSKFCLELGAKTVINRYQQDIVEAVKALGEVDVILNPVAGESIAKDQQYLAQDGRIILIGLMGGRSGEVDFGRMLMKRQNLIGSTLRALSSTQKGRILSDLWRDFGGKFKNNRIKPIIDKVFAADDIQQALDYVAANKTQGKVVVKLAEK